MMATHKNIYLTCSLRANVKKLERRIVRFYEKLISISFRLRELISISLRLREYSFESQIKSFFLPIVFQRIGSMLRKQSTNMTNTETRVGRELLMLCNVFRNI